MMKPQARSPGYHRPIILCLVAAMLLSGCLVPAAQPPGADSPTKEHSAPPAVSPDATQTPVAPDAAETAGSPIIQATPSTPEVVKIIVSSQPARSDVAVRITTVTPTVSPSPAPAEPVDLAMIPPDAAPLIFTSIGIDQKCGHGDIAASDGHILYATPRLLPGNPNFLELLPDKTRVDLIDCELWTDSQDVSWLAVRTPKKKLGWIIVQPDKLYATLYPIPITQHIALTGIPAGATIAYVPPSAGNAGTVPNEALATSIGLDFVPVVGDLKGVAEAATGYDLVTGEDLGNWRWFGLLGLIGLSEIALLRHGDEAADAARVAGNIDPALRHGDEAADALRHGDDVGDAARQSDEAAGLGRHVDDASDLAKAAGKVDNLAGQGVDAARLVDNAGSQADEAARIAAKFEQPCSFSADTLVSTMVGQKPIHRVRPGELVLAYNETAQTQGYYTVTNVFAHLDPVVVNLSIGGDILRTTPEHPFYVENQWTPASDLMPGDRVVSASGETGVIRQIQALYQPQVMYNLTVTEAHTYFVGSGEWLVHNACSRALRENLRTADRASVEAMEAEGVAWQAHHIIPGEYEDHPFVRKAIDEGHWKIDSADNGIALPFLDEASAKLGIPAHRGYHSQYSSDVGRELDQLQDAADAAAEAGTPWSGATHANELEKLIKSMRSALTGAGRLR